MLAAVTEQLVPQQIHFYIRNDNHLKGSKGDRAVSATAMRNTRLHVRN